MRTTTLWLGLMLAVAAIGIWGYRSAIVDERPRAVVETPAVQHSSEQALRRQASSQDDPPLPTTTEGLSAGAPVRPSDIPHAWHPADPQDAESSIPSIRRDISDRRLVELSIDSIVELEPGSTFSVFVPQLDKNYAIQIQSVTRTGNTTSTQGRLAAETIPFPFVLTAGPGQTFATVNTPEGVFQLSGNDRLAWIVPAKELDRLVDFSKPDFVVEEDATPNEVAEELPENVEVRTLPWDKTDSRAFKALEDE